MSQGRSTTRSWGAWSQPGRRPHFDAGAYGRPQRPSTVQSKSTAPLTQIPTPASTAPTLVSHQNPKSGLGDGLAPPVIQVESPKKEEPETIRMDNDTAANSAIPNSDTKHLQSTKISTTKSSDRQSNVKTATEPPLAERRRPKTSTQSEVPQWGHTATKPPKSKTEASEQPSFSQSEARAAARAERPSLRHYQQRRSGTNHTTRIKSAVPEVQSMVEEFETRRMQIHNDSGQRRLQKNQKKYDTTDLAILHQIRRELPLKKDKACEVKIKRYQRLGESPANWPASQSSAEPGDASQAFAKSRDEIRAQALQVKEEKQARGRTDNQQNGQYVEDEEVAASKQPKLLNSKRNAKWVTPDEIRAEVRRPGSNDFGSAHPDEATPSEGSLQAVYKGENGRSEKDGPDPGLVGWDGKFLEAPADWEGRPKAHAQKYRPEHGDFGLFLNECFHQQYPQESFAALPEEMVMDINLHADGISMAPRSQTVTLKNPSSQFGHSDTVLLEVSQLLQNCPESQFLTGTTEAEFDLVEPTPDQAMDEIGYAETSEYYSQRYMAMRARPQQNLQPKEETTTPTAAAVHNKSDPWNKKPDISIYLRPAARDDLPQLVEIYNWHIENGPRPTEMEVISDVDMRHRLDDAADAKLPLIVAVANFKSKKRNVSNKVNSTGNRHPVQNVNTDYHPIVTQEKIVGWASAADWSASDYVERIAAEIEVYVDPDYRMKGVGGCLMDKMLQICDRGYIGRNPCEFSCLPEHSYMYSNGGARDLHKVWFLVRNWSKPVKTPDDQKLFKDSDREDEVEIWLSSWLESMNFVQEGHLRQIGAKNGRFIDLLQYGRITGWQPIDGQIPDPLPGTI